MLLKMTQVDVEVEEEEEVVEEGVLVRYYQILEEVAEAAVG
jgi:hypothetical protein